MGFFVVGLYRPGWVRDFDQMRLSIFPAPNYLVLDRFWNLLKKMGKGWNLFDRLGCFD